MGALRQEKTDLRVGEIIKNWRIRDDLTQKAAANQLGIPMRTLQNWEQETRTPNTLALKAILEHIDATKRRQTKPKKSAKNK